MEIETFKTTDAAGTLVDKMKGKDGKGGLSILTEKSGLKLDKFGGGVELALRCPIGFCWLECKSTRTVW